MAKKGLFLALLALLCGTAGVPSASEGFSAGRPLSVGIVSLSRIHEVSRLLERTRERLEETLGPHEIDIREYTSEELEKAVRDAQIDVFIASSGFYWRMMPYGVRDAGTMISAQRPDPDHASAITFLTRAENTSLRTIGDMRGLRLSASYETAFMGYRIGLAEIAAAGFDPDAFFASTLFSEGPGIGPIVRKLLEGRADVAFVQACWLESLPPDERAKFRVVAPKDADPLSCVHSTRAYPNITVGVLKKSPPGLASEVARVLLSLPEDEHGERWGLATDFQSVDEVYRLLKIERYAYLRDWRLTQWIAAHRHWIAAACFCIALLCVHSAVLAWLVKRRTAELVRANAEREEAGKRLEELQNRVENTRRANTVSQLSSMIAHELAQPVGAALSFCEGLRIRIENQTLTEESLRRSLLGMERGLGRVRRIVEKVRSYSRGNIDREAPQRLDEILLTARASLPSALRDFPGLTIQVPKGLMVLGDELELELLFNNLLSNAVRAAEPSSDPQVKVRADEAEETVVVTIENSGERVSSGELERFSEPFVSEKGSGHGLGIPIAFSIAEASGGNMRYEPLPGGGVRAVVTLRRGGSDRA